MSGNCLVLGMHKSGTTLIARLMHESGVSMGDFPARQGYEKCKYEDPECVAINKHILGAEQKPSFRTIQSWVYDEEAAGRASELIAKKDEKYPTWGLKDPRLTLTYGFWKPFLGKHTLIVVTRNPREVFAHYMKGSVHVRVAKLITRATAVLRTWYVYNQACLDVAQSESDHVICIDFTEFMRRDTSLEKLEMRLGMKLKDVRDRRYYRSQAASSPGYTMASSLLKAVYGYDVDALYQRMRQQVCR